MLVDAHCHLDFPQFDHDRAEVFDVAKAVGVSHFVIPGTTRERWQHVLALAERGDTSVCLGLHPYFMAQHQEEDLAALDQLLIKHLDIVAVGECGIDARFEATIDAQWHYFDAQLRLAERHSLPVVVHCVHANDVVAKRLGQFSLPKAGLIHAFSGSIEQARKFLALGFKLGLGGAVTYERAKRLHRMVKALPDDAFVLETDSPDMPLNGYQGIRNEPSRLVEVCKAVARLRGQTTEQVAAQTSAVAATLFGLSIQP
ncbi:TatD family hydrolase [Vreelandella profundi]|uniref:TatD family hydrolase n=1 Tax=Vreelandella profundi TaxID=2852117 RepID=UPI001EF080C2|nr:TatD family hydrolase [Halomonas profundi]